MEKNAFIKTRLKDLLNVMDARANVNIFRQLKDGKQELLRSNKLFRLLSDNEFIGDRSIYNASVIGLSVSLGDTNILIKEA